MILIFIGCVFLLQNTGYLPPNFWMSLWRLWPVVLVLAGLELLLAQRVPWLVLMGLAVIVLVVGAIAMGSSLTPAPPAEAVNRTMPTPLGGATSASVYRPTRQRGAGSTGGHDL
jgi:hypothetical protein